MCSPLPNALENKQPNAHSTSSCVTELSDAPYTWAMCFARWRTATRALSICGPHDEANSGPSEASADSSSAGGEVPPARYGSWQSRDVWVPEGLSPECALVGEEQRELVEWNKAGEWRSEGAPGV
eukprot:CAMPEP_0118956964 /NCGR_PEP_ID=MMETSP1169-20130426/61852_1 /TAXON_ID=36882 /ORGANISM="Pyramimonas obovata, Strain CCMP722" /LENGTH=124 /DNA_ID=CAMNT_0006905015 /DNA_START=899 /DNA_END=1272 /DNA_ORIENTATION=-